jgi:hypothetical protein
MRALFSPNLHRLCSQGPCKHETRWLPRNATGRQDEEDGHTTPAPEKDRQMLMKYPADLAWSGLACWVRNAC